MLPKATADKLTALGFDVEKLVEAVKADTEVDITVPEGTLLTEKQLSERDTVKVTEGKKEGEQTARKAFISEVGKKMGFEPKSERIGDLVNELNEKINASGDEKLKTLQDQVSLLTKDKETLEGKVKEVEGTASEAMFERELIGYFDPARGSDLTDAERLLLLKGMVKFEVVDGVRVGKNDKGEIIRDPATQAPMPVKDIVASKFKEKPVLMGASAQPPKGGRGGNDNNGGASGGVKNLSQAKEAWKAIDPVNNVNTMSAEFLSYASDLAAKDTQFNMYE